LNSNKNIEIDYKFDIFQDINGFNDFNEINSYKKYHKKYPIQNNTISDDFEALTSGLTNNTNNTKNINTFDKNYIDSVYEYEKFMNDIVSYSEDLPNNHTKPIKINKNIRYQSDSNNTYFQNLYLSNSCPENNYYKPKQYISRTRSNSGSNTNVFDI
jgi:hypothetical protein